MNVPDFITSDNVFLAMDMDRAIKFNLVFPMADGDFSLNFIDRLADDMIKMVCFKFEVSVSRMTHWAYTAAGVDLYKKACNDIAAIANESLQRYKRQHVI